MTDPRPSKLDEAIESLREACAEPRRELAELQERFDRLAELHRVLTKETLINEEEEEKLLFFLAVNHGDDPLLFNIYKKLQRRKHAREEARKSD